MCVCVPLDAAITPCNVDRAPVQEMRKGVDLYTGLPLPILCGIHCNNAGSGRNIVLHDSVGGDGGGYVPKERVGA